MRSKKKPRFPLFIGLLLLLTVLALLLFVRSRDAAEQTAEPADPVQSTDAAQPIPAAETTVSNDGESAAPAPSGRKPAANQPLETPSPVMPVEVPDDDLQKSEIVSGVVVDASPSGEDELPDVPILVAP